MREVGIYDEFLKERHRANNKTATHFLVKIQYLWLREKQRYLHYLMTINKLVEIHSQSLLEQHLQIKMADFSYCHVSKIVGKIVELNTYMKTETQISIM